MERKTYPLLDNPLLRERIHIFLDSRDLTTQLRWDPLDEPDVGYARSDLDEASRSAMKKRDAAARAIRKSYPALTVKSWTLAGQLRPYASFGVPDGHIRSVYYITLVKG